MAAIDGFGTGKALGMGALLAAINPKNALLTIAAAAAIAQTGIAAGEQAVALAVFVVIATLGVAAPLGVYFLMGERAAKILDELKDWMARNNGAIMAVIVLVFAAKLIGDGITGLTG
jgi:threonine/homoserine/homoserine lactone efflux protein